LLILVAVLTQNVESVLNAAFDLRGLTSGALLGGLLLAVFWKKARPRPVILAMAASVSVMIVINRFFKESVFWPWYTLIGTLVTFSVTFSLAPLFAPGSANDGEAKQPGGSE
jgi:Na+/proline symporter